VKKVLIVEDDPSQRKLLNTHLRANDYETVFAADAVGAISIARKEKPDVILLDVRLPAGDAPVVVDRLRDLVAAGHIPIILVTACSPDDPRVQAIRDDVEHFFQKPVDHEHLLATIHRLVT
jgi:CheY-like chemotaxis protein